MKTRRSLLRGLAALGVAASLSLPAQAADPVRIGFAIAKTGPFVIASDPQLKAYELWKEQVNARGGLNVAGTKRPVEFVMYDDQSKPDQAVRLYEKLITSDKVDLLIAPWGTPFHIAIAPVLEKYKFPVVGATAASVRLRELKPGYIWFTTSAIPDKLAAELAALCVDNKVKTVSIINNVLPFTKEIRTFLDPKLQEKGIVIKTSAEYPPDTKDMTAMLTQIKQANPDAVLALSYPPDSVLYAKQARELGISAPIQFVAIGPTEAFFAQVMGKAHRGHHHDRTLDAARRMEGVQGVLRCVQAEVQRAARLPRLCARLHVAGSPRAGGREGRTGSREDPPDSGLRYLRNHQRQGEVRRRAERHHADGLPPIPERHAATGVATLLRLRESAPEEGLGLMRGSRAEAISVAK